MFMPKVLQLISGTKFPFIGGKKNRWAVYHVSVTANKKAIIIVSF